MKRLSLEQAGTVRFAGRAAYISAVASIVGTLCLVLFFAVGQPFGSLNDCFSGVIASLVQLPLTQFFYHLHRTRFPRASPLIAWFGVAALLFFPVASVVVILKAYEVGPFAQASFGILALQAVAFMLVGIWLILVNSLSLVTATLPRALAWLGIISGTPLGLVFYPLWAIWLGRALTKTTADQRPSGVATNAVC